MFKPRMSAISTVRSNPHHSTEDERHVTLALTMTDRTISEQLFESLCSGKAIPCRKIPTGLSKTPDYEIVLGFQRVAVEVKQLDENEQDKGVNRALDAGRDTGGVTAPTSRLRKKIAEGYRQLKAVARDGQPCLLVVYNNSGFLNFIDAFTVTTAMFGSFGVRLGLTTKGYPEVIRQGFMDKQKITRNTCKRLSAIGVLKAANSRSLELVIYHNPYAVAPIQPATITALAASQFLHPDPHSGNFVTWEPPSIEA